MLQLVGARVLGFRPELVLAIVGVIVPAYAELGLDAVLRFGIDGAHSVGSEHYAGAGADFRLHHVPPEKRATLVERIRAALGPDYDVLWEFPGKPEEHLHVEFDPKNPY